MTAEWRALSVCLPGIALAKPGICPVLFVFILLDSPSTSLRLLSLSNHEPHLPSADYIADRLRAGALGAGRQTRAVEYSTLLRIMGYEPYFNFASMIDDTYRYESVPAGSRPSETANAFKLERKNYESQ